MNEHDMTDIEREFIAACERPSMPVCVEGNITRSELMRLARLCRDDKNFYVEIENSTEWPKTFIEHDLARFLSEQGATLIMAGFDNANQEVFNRTLGLAKLLTERRNDATLVIAGHEIYFKILRAYPALNDRIHLVKF